LTQTERKKADKDQQDIIDDIKAAEAVRKKTNSN